MSTYYYLACDAHKAVSGVIGGRSFPDRWWSEDGDALADFLEAHARCEQSPVLVSEHDERLSDYEEVPKGVD